VSEAARGLVVDSDPDPLGAPEIGDRVRGLELGADDYLPKPFAVEELRARVAAPLRRRSLPQQIALTVGRIRLDRTRRTVHVRGSVVEMTAREYALLEYILLNRGRMVSRQEIAEHVWDESYAPGSNLIDVYVGRLRQKLDGLLPRGERSFLTTRRLAETEGLLVGGSCGLARHAALEVARSITDPEAHPPVRRRPDRDPRARCRRLRALPCRGVEAFDAGLLGSLDAVEGALREEVREAAQESAASSPPDAVSAMEIVRRASQTTLEEFELSGCSPRSAPARAPRRRWRAAATSSPRNPLRRHGVGGLASGDAPRSPRPTCLARGRAPLPALARSAALTVAIADRTAVEERSRRSASPCSRSARRDSRWPCSAGTGSRRVPCADRDADGPGRRNGRGLRPDRTHRLQILNPDDELGRLAPRSTGSSSGSSRPTSSQALHRGHGARAGPRSRSCARRPS
jgi:CheY-like chemotaxis protein